MIERLAIVAVLAITLTALVVGLRRLHARRVASLQRASHWPLWNSLGAQPDGRRTLVTFSTPSCAACHRAQAPAVETVEAQLGRRHVRVIRIDAAQRPEIARAFGVMTVPSTVVLAPAGHVVAVNQGFASTTRLIGQLQTI